MKKSKFAASILLFLLFLWLSGYAVFVFYTVVGEPQHPKERTQAIVVLTGGTRRIDTGLSLYASGLAPTLFITGVNEITTATDLTAGWDGPALPKCCIVLGHKARSTRDNATETEEWVREKKLQNIRLVTSSYHMPRAFLEFRRVMPDLKIVLHPVEEQASALKDIRLWALTFLEYNKTLFRFISVMVE